METTTIVVGFFLPERYGGLSKVWVGVCRNKPFLPALVAKLNYYFKTFIKV
jgi:hypothetical protein